MMVASVHHSLGVVFVCRDAAGIPFLKFVRIDTHV